MKMSDKARSKRAAKVAGLLPAGSQVRGYGEGRAHARVSAQVVAVVGATAAAMLVGLLFGRLLIPGAALVAIVFNLVRPPRGLAVTDRGVALIRRSFWTGRPKQVMAVEEVPTVTTGSGSRVTLHIDGERVTLPAHESAYLAAALGGLGQPADHGDFAG
jgi:hypothetical protein